MDKLNISLVLAETSELLKIDDANRYKIDSYKKASKTIKNLEQDIEILISNNYLNQLVGIGDGLAIAIEDIFKTGKCDEYSALLNKYPLSLTSLLKVTGIGASTAKSLYNELEINNLQELSVAANKGKLTKVKGIGAKSEAKIKSGVARILKFGNKIRIAKADDLATRLINYLEDNFKLNEIIISGELRRREELITEISLLFISEDIDFNRLKDSILAMAITDNIINSDANSILFKTKFGINIKFIKIKEVELGWINLSETGPTSFVNAIEDKTEKKDYPHEKEIFHNLGLPYIIPELRDYKEILNLADKDNLPNSPTRIDLKGDLHMHSQWSDGKYTIAEMANACQNKGYQYLAISDHTQTLKIANGLTPQQLKEQREEIKELNKKLEIEILAGAEVDILEDGLDYPDYILKELDIVTASVHTDFDISKAEMMTRIFKALENPFVNVLGHPTGRILAGRKGYNIDIKKLIKKAVATNTVLEINSSPKRLDLNAQNVRYAKKQGAKFIINTDAHAVAELDNIVYGIDIARKGLLEKSDIINTLPLNKLKEMLN